MYGREYTSYLGSFGPLTDFKVAFVAPNILVMARKVGYPTGARPPRNSLPKLLGHHSLCLWVSCVFLLHDTVCRSESMGIMIQMFGLSMSEREDSLHRYFLIGRAYGMTQNRLNTRNSARTITNIK